MSVSDPSPEPSAAGIALNNDPDGWAMDRLKEARRQVLHFEARGDKETAARWKRVERAVDYAMAMFLSTAKMPDPPDEEPKALALQVLREIAKSGNYDPARIDAVRILLSLEGVTTP
jgi:hypothetical protein